ncbi:MAG: hypothetical protein JXM73_12010 [Anaerolineae bacterium]|nr:hypothetical protein [Anaerolineae bacterium]
MSDRRRAALDSGTRRRLLRRRSDTPIAGGEVNGGCYEFTAMLEKGCSPR